MQLGNRSPGVQRHEAQQEGAQFLLSEFCPGNYTNQGYCNVSTAICSCNDQQGGQDCAIPLCPLYNECSNRGTCHIGNMHPVGLRDKALLPVRPSEPAIAKCQYAVAEVSWANLLSDVFLHIYSFLRSDSLASSIALRFVCYRFYSLLKLQRLAHAVHLSDAPGGVNAFFGDGNGFASAAAREGHLRLLQWGLTSGCPKPEYLCDDAATGGHLKILQWARTNGWSWDDDVIPLAAEHGSKRHLELIQWARANGCPFGRDCYANCGCLKAAQRGHMEIFQWLHNNGCPWDERICEEAALNGHLAILQWARAQGCPWNKELTYYAANNGHFEILKWARANGCDWDWRIAKCTHERHPEIFAWVAVNGLQLNDSWPLHIRDAFMSVAQEDRNFCRGCNRVPCCSPVTCCGRR